jgi:predicted DNA-binding protein (MmcQ/YjbR family)
MTPAKLAEKYRKLALGYPETYEESPWGDRVVKVKGKIFLFCMEHEGKLGMSVKLPKSGRALLKNEWAKPTAYGLGKSGWVSITLGKGDRVSEASIAEWIDESYRALAPKKLVAQLESAPARMAAKSVANKKLAHKVILLCEDELRSQRAIAALLQLGVTASAADSPKKVRAKLSSVDAVIVDLGRSQDEGIALAKEIDHSDHPIHLFIVGIRDARADKRSEEAATSAERFRDPPGDGTVAAAIAATLSQHPPRKR